MCYEDDDCCDYDEDPCDDCGEEYDCDFQDPGGTSALRRATANNPRIYPCPTCGEENMLTAKDVRLHYQCDLCSDRQERGYDY